MQVRTASRQLQLNSFNTSLRPMSNVARDTQQSFDPTAVQTFIVNDFVPHPQPGASRS